MKRRLKVLLAVAFVAALAVPAMAFAAAGFTDVDEADWFAADVEWAASEGLMTGSGDGAFEPNAGEARAMLISTLHRMEGEPAATAADPRVPEGAWYEGPANWALEEGLLVGYDDGGLGLLDELTREQLAVFMYRYAEWKGCDVTAGADADVLPYDDADDISPWAIPAMRWAVAEGLITGYTDADGKLTGVLDPKGTCTRAMTAAILHRFFDNVVPVEPEENPAPTPSVPSYPATPPHECTSDVWTTNEDGTHTGRCECGEEITSECTFGDPSKASDGTHTLSCQEECGYSVTEACTYGVSEADSSVYACDCGNTFTLTNDKGDGAVASPEASIGGTGYETLKAALEAASSGQTVVLLDDVKTEAQLNVPEGVALNGNGKTITVSESLGADNGSKHAMLLASGSRVDNLTVDSADMAYGIQAFNASNVVLNNVTTKNSLGAGLLVNNSSVAATNLNASGNEWGSVNVDKGSPSFILNGGSLEDKIQIYSELDSTAVVTAEGYHVYGMGGFNAWSTSGVQAALNSLEGSAVLTLLSNQSAEDLKVPEGKTLIVGADVDLTLTGETSGLIRDSEGAELVYSATQLKEFAAKVNDGDAYARKTVRLMADIDLGNELWTPIGPNADAVNKFKGTFDGNGKTIKNLRVKQDAGYHAAGFFGALNGTAKDFTVDGAYVESLSSGSVTDNGTAVVAGSIYSTGSIEGVTVKNAEVKGNRYVGGISGYTYGSVKDCIVQDSEITAAPDNLTGSYDNGDKAGGIVGAFWNESVYEVSGNTVSNVTVTAYRDLGGIAGFANGNVKDNTVSNLTLIQDSSYGYGKTEKNVAAVVGRTDGAEMGENNESDITVKCIGIASQNDLNGALAIGNSDIEITLAAGNYGLSSIGEKNVKIVGDGPETVFDFKKAYDVKGASVTFENLKIQGKNENVMSEFGIQGTTGDIVYKNCTFDGAVTNEYYGNVKYIDCTFTGTGYITTYSVKSATFEKCTFDKADSRAILVYSHGDNPVVVKIDDCAFKAAAKATTWAGDWTAAVEVDTTNISTLGTKVSISNCAQDGNYSGIVRDKSAAGKANAVITVDGQSFADQA